MEACATRYASGEKARRILGYEARVGIEEGLRISCDDYKRVLKVHRRNSIGEARTKREPHCTGGYSTLNARAGPVFLFSKLATIFTFGQRFV